MASIYFHRDNLGGFTCADTSTGRTAYAYPSSGHAAASRRNPEAVARVMLSRSEVSALPSVVAYHAANWSALLHAGAISLRELAGGV